MSVYEIQYASDRKNPFFDLIILLFVIKVGLEITIITVNCYTANCR